MASKNGARYKLRSSQRANEFEEYETPQMDDLLTDSNNAMLSQGDTINSQMDHFFLNTFGAKFNNINGSEFVGLDDVTVTKEENDPSLCRFNYIQDVQANQLQAVPLENDNQDWLTTNGSDYDEFGGAYSFSQDRNQHQKFVVAVMPQAKAANLDYMSLGPVMFVRFHSQIPFTFLMTNPHDSSESIPMPAGMRIRISLRYEIPVSDDKKVVKRCHVHVGKFGGTESSKHFPFSLNHKDAVYDLSTLSATIPSSTVVSARFYCYSSCAGGIDRKAVYLLFELLHYDGSVSQEVRFPVKVCANPSRDAPKEEERRLKDEAKRENGGRLRVKSEISSEMVEEKGRKRKAEGGEDERQMKMSAPRKSSSTCKRDKKLELRSTSTEGSNEKKDESEDDEDTIYNIQIRGKKKYQEVMKMVKLLEKDERYSARNQEDNPFENLTQVTPDLSISTWLAQYKLDTREVIDNFYEMGIYNLDDIQFTPTLFRQVGIAPKNAARLNMIYLNWLNVSMVV